MDLFRFVILSCVILSSELLVWLHLCTHCAYFVSSCGIFCHCWCHWATFGGLINRGKALRGRYLGKYRIHHLRSYLQRSDVQRSDVMRELLYL